MFNKLISYDLSTLRTILQVLLDKNYQLDVIGFKNLYLNIKNIRITFNILNNKN